MAQCRPWRRLDAQAWAARASSSSGAASTSSASCAPTATPTPRSTTATTSSDCTTASAAVRRQTDVEPRPASSWSHAHGSHCPNGARPTASHSDSLQTDLSAATSWNRTCVSDVTTAHVAGPRVTKLSAVPSWNRAHASDVTNGVEPAPTTADPSWNFLEVQNSDSVRGRRTTACVQTVPTSHRANVTAHVSDVKNLSASSLRPPLPFNAHHHRNDFLMPGNVTNIVPNVPFYSLNAQNHIPPQNEGRINFNTHTCSNVPNWNRSVDILKALHSAIPHNSNQADDRNVRQTSNVGRPIFDIYAVSSENPKEDYYGDVGNQNSNSTLYYRSKPEEATSSCTCVPISIPRVSSWSFTKKTVATTPTVYPNRANFDTTHQSNMIKIQSADNIRRLQFINASVPSTSGQAFSNDRANYPPNDNDNGVYCPQISPKGAICHQPRENNVAQIQIPNLGSKNVLPDYAKNSVVHWTNSVENRVCCPETVLYGAVYGLKCLK
ncbi:flocculation protein FLO11-like [Maniola jurtina]|uniref:flocculation protein FLO11-like n=1 Tax=Maniola jurtina TaxID=191418 RepID=UPI001E68A8C7|nr:flocculation protein FLO11-like [Maniola jurtina]